MKKKIGMIIEGMVFMLLLSLVTTYIISAASVIPVDQESMFNDSEVSDQIRQGVRSEDPFTEAGIDVSQLQGKDTTDEVTVHEDNMVEVKTADGCYMKIKYPFGMIALTQAFLSQGETYMIFSEPVKIYDYLKKTDTHIYLTDLLSGTRINIICGEMEGSSDTDALTEEDRQKMADSFAEETPDADVSIVPLGEHFYYLFDYETYRKYLYENQQKQFIIYVRPGGEYLDKFDLKNIDKILEEAVFSADQG